MNKITRYIAWQVILATLMVMVVIFGIEFFLNLVSQFSSIGKHHYGFSQAFIYVALQMPQLLYHIFPMIGFLGAVLGLGKLSSGSELIVMRAAGFSKNRIIYAVMVAALCLLLIMTVTGEVFAPHANQLAQQIRSVALNQLPDKLSTHVWLKDHNTFIYIANSPSSVKIANITLFQFDSQYHLLKLVHANRGHLVDGHWQLYDIVESRYADNRVTTAKYAQLPLHVYYSPKLQAATKSSSLNHSIIELWHNIFYLKAIGLTAREFQFQFWVRLLQPVTTLLMIVLGVPFVFGSLRHSSIGAKIMVGVVVGFGFYMLNQLFGPITLLFNCPPLLAAAAPALLFLMIYLLMMQRVN